MATNYSQKYKEAEAKGDKAGMYNAAKAADDIRAAQGQARINDALLTKLSTEYQYGSVDPTYASAQQSGNYSSYNAVAENIRQANSKSSGSSGSSDGSSGSSNYVYKPVDNTALYEQQAAEQKRAQAAAIKAARDSTVSGYNQQISTTGNTYNPLRNQASVQGAVNARSIKEAMAASGQANSGENLTQSSASNAQTTGTIANISLQESDLVNRLKEAIANANSSADLQTLQSNSTIDAQKIGNIVNERSRLADQANSNYWNQQNLDLSAGQLTGIYGNTPTLAAQGQQFSQGLATQQQGLAAQNQQFNQNMATQQFAESVKQNNISQSNWQQQFSYAQMQDKIQNMQQQGQLSISQANVALQQAKFNADQDPNSIDNRMKQQQMDMNTQAKQESSLNNIIQRLDTAYLVKTEDDLGRPQTILNPTFTKDQIRASIIVLNLPDEQTDSLLLRYGLPINQGATIKGGLSGLQN